MLLTVFWRVRIVPHLTSPEPPCPSPTITYQTPKENIVVKSGNERQAGLVLSDKTSIGEVRYLGWPPILKIFTSVTVRTSPRSILYHGLFSTLVRMHELEPSSKSVFPSMAAVAAGLPAFRELCVAVTVKTPLPPGRPSIGLSVLNAMLPSSRFRPLL